ncbi:hypothetical protein JAAARDRAFT_187524 [Jaapia argillacea MUCL 33604]|uniref:Uncharacterized protein n=1 Tax=Jaapia argillacea MUCL 33604 TaxID=933084 RepID=A0A067QKW0_9AGAM|nr:hypothetical protein JAAARDRAFT_187524 [Jaapia argillacea MUCL 33604]
MSSDGAASSDSGTTAVQTPQIQVTISPAVIEFSSSGLSDQDNDSSLQTVAGSGQEGRDKEIVLVEAQHGEEEAGLVREAVVEGEQVFEGTPVESMGSGEEVQEISVQENYEMKRVKAYCDETVLPLVPSFGVMPASVEKSLKFAHSPDSIRVVYELVGSRWADQGTAFCFGDVENNEAYLIARAEADFSKVILQTTIRSNDVYQRQQDTLIVWTEPDGVDYALSFQDPEGCAEVWNFIVDIQRHMNASEEQVVGSSSPLIGPEPPPTNSVTTASIIRAGRLPQPQLGIIGEIEKAIKALARTPALKERICEYIQHEEYIKALVDVLTQAEDLESIDNLHALCSLMQTILMLNDHTMYEHILDDNLFFGVVGMLEYDPEFPTFKANYRDFLKQTSRFHQPIPIRDETIQKKIHHTYRLLFLKDVVLARAIDDSTFNVLNSCIIFNQIDIINHVQNDNPFLNEVIGLFVDFETLTSGAVKNGEEGKAAPNGTVAGTQAVKAAADPNAMDIDKTGPAFAMNGAGVSPHAPLLDHLSPEELALRREVVILIQQLCAMGKNVQLPARMALFRTLVDRGIVFAVQWALSHSDKTPEGKAMISVGGEILATLLDHDMNGVRGHVLKQITAIERDKDAGKKGADRAETVLGLMCRLLAGSRDLAVQSQIGEQVKALLEIPQGDGTDANTPLTGIKMLGRAKDDPGTEKYLEYFYKHCIETLFKPFADIPEFKNLTGTLPLTREKSNLLLYLCDLLSGFALQHSFRSHFYILSSNISTRVASLLRARDKHLRLAAFRYFRACLKLNNRNLFNHLIKHDILKPILDLTLQESRRDNLLSCSCQEFFEHMRRENVKELINYCMTKHGDIVRKLAQTGIGGPRFKGFIRRWEINVEPPPPTETPKGDKATPSGPRVWGQGRLMEVEEEDYFNNDDDEDEPQLVTASPFSRGQITPPLNAALKRKRLRGLGTPMRPLRPPNPTPPRSPSLGSLLDYHDDEDADAPSSTTDGSTTRSQRWTPSSPQPNSPSPTLEVPARPTLSHKQITPSPKPEPEDEEDKLLDALVSKAGPPSPSLLSGGFGSSFGPLRPSEKRRRDDEDDELLERLASKAKKPSTGVAAQQQQGEPIVGRVGVGGKGGEEGPKKIKLKFGAAGMAVAASSPSGAPSEPGAKDGDTG